MNFNAIVKKLVIKNKKEYLLTIFGIAFAVFVIAMLGVIIFSPSVTNVFYPGGTSQKLARGLYGMTALSCIIFILFVQGLFMRYKSKEIGIFMSLGVKKKDISRLIKKELFYIIPTGAILGMLLSIPCAMLLWYVLAFAFDSEKIHFTIGWSGIAFSVLFSILVYFMINILTNYYLKKVNVIKLLRTASEIEAVAFGNTLFGIIGILCIPLGLIAMAIGFDTSHPILKHFFKIGIILDILGIYFFSTQVSTIGAIVQRINKRIYFTNIIFFNLIKLKGRQFALSLFIGTALIAAGLSSAFFTLGNVIGSFEAVKNSKYDFGYLQTLDCKELGKSDLEALALRNNHHILQYKELEGIMLATYKLMTDFSPDWNWDEDAPFVSESSFNQFFEENIRVPQDKYVIAVTTNLETDFQNEMLRPRFQIKFFTADKKEVTISPDQSIEIYNKMFGGSEVFRGMVRVLNDRDYQNLQGKVDASFKFKYKTFNIDNYNKSIQFSNDFFNAYLKVHNYTFPKWFSLRGSDRINGRVTLEEKITQMSSEVKRNWGNMPYSRIDLQANGIEDSIIYILVFGIIALSCLVASGFIIGIKILSSVWEEKLFYKNLNFLGCKGKYIKSMINKQVRLLYVFPNILASIIILNLYTSAFKNSMVYHDKVIFASYVIVFINIGLSYIMSMLIGKKIHKECMKFIQIS